MKSLAEEFGLNLKGICQNINELDGVIPEDPKHDVYLVKRDDGSYGIFMYRKAINKFVDIEDMTYMFAGIDFSTITEEDVEKLRIPKDITNMKDIFSNLPKDFKLDMKDLLTTEEMRKMINCKEML